MTLPRSRSTNTPIKPVIGQTEHKLLTALLFYHLLTAEQLCRLYFARGSLTYVQTLLKRLADAGYVHRIVRKTTRYGSAPLVYTLARKGLRYLEQAGVEVPTRHNPSELRQLSDLHVQHTLALNDLLIALSFVPVLKPHVTIARLLHERQLRRQPVYVKLPDGRRRGIVADAWADLRLRSPSGAIEQLCLAVELDRSTTFQREWRSNKVQGYLACSQGDAYAKRFETTSLNVIVVATEGPQRVESLVRWTEAQLTEQGAQDLADLFWFTHMTEPPSDPAAFFCEARWRQPFRKEVLPLLDT